MPACFGMRFVPCCGSHDCGSRMTNSGLRIGCVMACSLDIARLFLHQRFVYAPPRISTSPAKTEATLSVNSSVITLMDCEPGCIAGTYKCADSCSLQRSKHLGCSLTMPARLRLPSSVKDAVFYGFVVLVPSECMRQSVGIGALRLAVQEHRYRGRRKPDWWLSVCVRSRRDESEQILGDTRGGRIL